MELKQKSKPCKDLFHLADRNSNVMKILHNPPRHLFLCYWTKNESDVMYKILWKHFCGVSVEVIPETDEEKMARFEAVLLQDLSVLKHRQVIHPVLQEGQFMQTHINMLEA